MRKGGLALGSVGWVDSVDSVGWVMVRRLFRQGVVVWRLFRQGVLVWVTGMVWELCDEHLVDMTMIWTVRVVVWERLVTARMVVATLEYLGESVAQISGLIWTVTGRGSLV